jgi:glycosyltransferase 2 family protein
VTLPREDPPPTAGPSPAPVRPAAEQLAAERADAIQVEDRLESRVRIPADLLRCVIAVIEIALLAALGVLGRATANGAETDIVLASQRLPKVLLDSLGYAAHAALLILPAALAIRILIRRQPRRLAEGAGAGGVTVGVVLVADLLLKHPAAAGLYDVLTPVHTLDKRVPALDWYLSGLTAYVTVVGLSGRPRWRTVFWLAVGFYALASLADAQTTVFSVLITVLLGVACGSGLRYAFGAMSERPSAAEIAEALRAVDLPVAGMSRIWDSRTETRRYTATLRGGGRLDVTVFDRDQQAADVFYRLYRRLRLRTQVSRNAPLTLERAMERRALLTYATEDAGVPTPRLCALIRAGPEAAVLANESHGGTTLADLPEAPTDEQLGQIWDVVLRLHSRRVTHRGLTADRILLISEDERDGCGQPHGLGTHPQDGGRPPGATGGEVMLLDPGDGDVAASDLQLRLDLAQLAAELALLVGPDRAASSARQKVSGAELAAVATLLQPVALHRSTRSEVRRHRDVLPALRRRLRAAGPGAEAAPVRLERIRLRTLVTLVAAVFAAYILAGELNKKSLGNLLRHADWRFTLAALGLSALTYVGATLSLSGFVLEELNRTRTFLVQVAGSFITLVAPAAVGGVALNIRYLRQSKVAPADAAASVGVSQVFAFALHMLLLVIFAALTGASRDISIRPPEWAYIALAVLVGAILAALAVPPGRKLLLSRLAPTLGQVIPRILEIIAQRPAKLAEGIGGTLLVTAAYVGCLAVSVRAFGGSLPIVAVAIVYLTGSAIGSAVPTPGGLGAVEAALSAGLTAAGLHGATAISSVLLFRTVTFWLPVPLGWASLNYLQRHDAL